MKKNLDVDKRAVYKEMDPKDELQDYSGPFKPDLRYSDFSKEQLVKMLGQFHSYAMDAINSIAMWVFYKFGWEEFINLHHEVWTSQLAEEIKKNITETMNITSNDIEALMKALQTDATWGPIRHRLQFEMPSKDRGVITIHKCSEVDRFEPMGMMEVCRMSCEQTDVAAITEYAKMFHPDIVTKAVVLPPRESPDDICCQWEFTYK